MKKKVSNIEKMGHDEIYNLHQFAYEEEGFVHFIATYPDLICVVGSQFMLAEVKQLLREKAELVFGYDTTFSVGTVIQTS
jgi:hypothetical protein